MDFNQLTSWSEAVAYDVKIQMPTKSLLVHTGSINPWHVWRQDSTQRDGQQLVNLIIVKLFRLLLDNENCRGIGLNATAIVQCVYFRKLRTEE